MKRLVVLSLLIFLVSLSACKKTHHLQVGTIAGPETQLMQVAAGVAEARFNLQIDVVPFTDYATPNRALDDASIDANLFQHGPYLDNAIKKGGYHIAAIGKMFLYPMGIYSKKIKKMSDLKLHAMVALPNDPSNETRALRLLERAGLIRLRSDAGVDATVNDIASNPKQLQFKELDAALLARMLDDADLAVINTNYALAVGLDPKKEALFLEGADSPYVNLLVVRVVDKRKPVFQKLLEALHSQPVLDKAQELFKGNAIPGWSIQKSGESQ